jgi:kynurenine formamidase
MQNSQQNSLTQLHDLMSAADVIDLSPLIENDMPRFPTHPPVVINQTVTHAHDGYYCQTIFMPEHAGAHVDSPYHIHDDLKDRTIEVFPADFLLGPCKVVHLENRDWEPGEYAAAKDILAWEQASGEKIENQDIVLFNFGWLKKYWTTGKDWKWYSMNEPGLSEDASELLLSRKIKAIGSDTVACGTALKDGKPNPEAPPPNHCWIHNNLLSREILIIECLANMEQVPNACFFMALPLKIKSGSGSPIRPVAVVL